MLRNFFRKPRETAWIFPSSKSSAEAVSKCIDFRTTHCLVELGCGTGSITKGILKNETNKFRLIGLEINEEFCKHLKSEIKDKRFEIHNAEAQDLLRILKKENIEKVDCIVCSVPLFAISEQDRQELMVKVKSVLSDNGRFIHYLGHPFGRNFFKTYFPKHSMKVCIANAPPIFINICEA